MALPTELHPPSAGPTLEVLLVYGVVFVVAVAASKLISTLVVTMLDRRAAALGREKPRGVRPGSDAAEFTIGLLPRARQILSVAYLRAGTERVAETLVALAVTSGWLVFGRDDIHLGALPRDASREARDLHRELEIGKITRERVNAAAKRVALSLEPAIVAELESASLLRSWTVRRLGEMVAVLVAAPAVMMGLLRLLDGARAAGTGESAGRIDGGLLFLALEIVGFALIAFALARVSAETELAGKYLAWLDDATLSLREDVASGRDHRVADVMLATALGATVSNGELPSGVVPDVAGGGGGCGTSGCGTGGGCGSG